MRRGHEKEPGINPGLFFLLFLFLLFLFLFLFPFVPFALCPVDCAILLASQSRGDATRKAV